MGAWEDAEAIEAARAQAVRQRGFSPGIPRLQIYAREEEGGLAHQHAYAISAAAFVDQVDRALCGRAGEPHERAMKAMVARTCWRLGCRCESPLEWHPVHLMTGADRLKDDLTCEAYLQAMIRMGRRGRVSG